jgi:hypothetical protein
MKTILICIALLLTGCVHYVPTEHGHIPVLSTYPRIEFVKGHGNGYYVIEHLSPCKIRIEGNTYTKPCNDRRYW